MELNNQSARGVERWFQYAPWVLKEPLCEVVWAVDIHDTELKIKDMLLDVG